MKARIEVRFLSEQIVREIHRRSLSILERVGVVIPHDEVLGRFADAGARVERGSSRVYITEEIVEKSLHTAGKSFSVYGRDLLKRADFGASARNYNSIAGEGMWLEEPGKERRYAALQDVETASRFAENLHFINIVGAMADPQELPVRFRSVAVTATLLRNTTKPIYFWFHDRKSTKYLIEILTALRGSEEDLQKYPPCFVLLEPISPLRFPFNGLDLLFETSRVNLPVHIGPMAQMGLSAPATLAGTMAQENAEILAGICAVQLIHPGTPVCYGGICHSFDMRTTQLIFGGPEQALFGVAMTQMGKFYGLPVYINVGLTDSKRPDAQAGLEAGVTLVLGVLAGADIFGHFGIVGVDQASSLDMLVLQHEVISYVESTVREVGFSQDTFALEELQEAGPGGTFIDRVHTASHFRKELWFPELLDRQYYDTWLQGGQKSLEEICGERKRELLAKPGAPPLPEEMEREIGRILESARRELGEGDSAEV